MNGLIGYGSSSEDEEEALPSVAVAAEASSLRVNHDTPAEMNGASKDELSVLSSEVREPSQPIQGPMVGPAMPNEFAATDYDDENDESSLPMPERDMLRHLTQPSRPMSSLPPEPREPADVAVTARFRRFLELKSKGTHFNEDLAGKTSFKNPSLFVSLLERVDLSSQAQYSSTLSSDVFSLSLFPDWAYKESLLKSQQSISADTEATKKSQSIIGKRTIEFTPAGLSGTRSRESTPSSLSKRKRN